VSDFKNALDLHLSSIAKRDLAAFSEFFHPSQSSIIILPSGHMIEGFESIIDFHKDWFADADWRMETKILDTVVIESVGYALLDVIYHDLDENGKPYEMKYLLSLLFSKIDDKWILIRDQNTLK